MKEYYISTYITWTNIQLTLDFFDIYTTPQRFFKKTFKTSPFSMENYQPSSALLFGSSSSSSPPLSSLTTSLQMQSNSIDQQFDTIYNNNIITQKSRIWGLNMEKAASDHQYHTSNVTQGINYGQAADYDDQIMKSSSVSINNKKKDQKKESGTSKKKGPKYAFQTRSHVDILDDGYRWRKYGQKAVKNNKFQRSYYRCTQRGCTVKKQVQRLSNDEEIVVTTYEGMHSHPIEKSNDNFEHLLSQMHIYPSF